jgi:hypothetical protein
MPAAGYSSAMPVRGTFHMTFSGPPEQIAAVLKALTAAGFAAKGVQSPYPGDPQESALVWVEASTHEGTDSPSAEFEVASLDRAQQAVEPHGYRLRIHGSTVGGIADQREVVQASTGEVLVRTWAESWDAGVLAEVSELFGIPVEDLELRELPGLWDLPPDSGSS